MAIDAARAARRLGAEKVSVVYRRTRQEMPAYAEEIEGALEEGVEVLFLTAPEQVVSEDGRVTGLACIQTKLSRPDQSGRRRPVPMADSEFVLPCDTVIPAIGQRIDTSWLENAPGLTCAGQALTAHPLTMRTALPHVFAGGDAVTGPATVIEAVACGHRAVEAIDCFLNGEDLDELAESLAAQAPPGQDWREAPEGLAATPRVRTDSREASERTASFDEVGLGFSEEAARSEAARCLNCGGCCECMECLKVCEASAIDHGQKEEILDIQVGSIILSTGYDVQDPTPMVQYGYGRYPNVFTGLEFERLSNATGPTGGRILIRDERGEFTRVPQSVAIVHCVGSRDVNYHAYCSRVCCMYALKYDHLLKEKVGHETEVYNFYIDMRCFGKGYEEFYSRCQQDGTIFIRGKVAQITDKAADPEEEGRLIVMAEDTLMGRFLRVPVDMVILCTAMEARGDAIEVCRLFGVNLGADGFFLEEHPKLRPLNTATDGVFLAGTCQGPKDIPDTVSQASGAAAKALSLATLGKVEVPSATAWIDPDLCAGCQTCIGLCPLHGHRVRRAPAGLRGQRNPVQGLRKLRRVLPQRRRPDQALQGKADFFRTRRHLGRDFRCRGLSGEGTEHQRRPTRRRHAH